MIESKIISNNTRNSNIELLRIICMLGVIVMHYNYSELGQAFTFAEDNSIKSFILYFLESISIIAVNVFIIISGYFLSVKQDRSYWKPIKLILQVIIVKLGYTLFSGVITKSISIKYIIASFVPNNYYVILYCVLYVISPYINLIIAKISSDSGLKRLVIILVIVFGLYPTVVDLLGGILGHEIIGLSSIGMYGSQYGYQIVNFSMLYVIGAVIRRGVFDKLKLRSILIFILVDIVIMVLWNELAHSMDLHLGAWDYCNPLVILNSLFAFLMFRKIEIRNQLVNKLINTLARGVFMAYLVHSYFYRFLQIERFVKGNIILLMLHILISAVVLFLIGYIMFIIYDFVTGFIYKPLQKKFPLNIGYKMTE